MVLIFKRTVILVLLFLTLGGVSNSASHLSTLEQSGYMKLTSSPEIETFLSILSHSYVSAEKETIATTALGNQVNALLISLDVDRFKKGELEDNKLTVMLVGSQHGTETSGAEAILLVARDVLEGKLGSCLEDMNLIFIPNSNPDGRNLKRRRNGNGADINRNYTILSEPESRGIINALHRWGPEVVLDVHEAAALKKKTLAREGYLTAFEAQFETANNPNVDRHIRTYSFTYLLPQILDRVKENGLAAQRYIKNFSSLDQPITHGDLSLAILRNMAGMLGSFSFLLENKLDPSTGTYPTPRNIRVRVSKQYLCITTFLNCCRIHRSQIMAISRNARMRWKTPKNEEPLYLASSYVADTNNTQITLPLRRIGTGSLIKHSFRYNGAVAADSPLSLPSSYIITSHQNLIADILSRHHVIYRRSKNIDSIFVKIRRIENHIFENARTGWQPGRYSFDERKVDYLLRPGDLVVDLNQSARRLIPLLLEFQSSSSIFNTDDYHHLVEKQKDFFIFPAE